MNLLQNLLCDEERTHDAITDAFGHDVLAIAYDIRIKISAI
jgi:hypothetical protein